jgi:DNA repair exonuclease SbcCD nuclease subunit
MKGGGLGEAGPIVRETRIESINNVLKAAQEKKVDFVLLCGDIFEHNMVSQEDVKKVVTIFNRYPDIPLYLLPGNHDIIGADCIYNRPIFQGVKHLTILRTNDSIEAPGATIHPCLVLSKFSTKDFSNAIPEVRELDGIHIGVAHGNLVGKFSIPNWEAIDLPIDPLSVERTGIDYLALGHWHNHRSFEDTNGITRMAYSGTHEQTNYDEDDAGQCLLVQIDRKGDAPKIESIKAGRLTWESMEFEMKDASSLIELKKNLESIKGIDMVRLTLDGRLPLECKKELDNILEFQTTLHKNLRVKLESLYFEVPPQLEATFDFGDSTLNQTAAHLKQLLANEKDHGKHRIIVEALAHLQRFVKEAER